MALEIKGRVHEISATQQVTDKLKKRELVIEYAENPEYKEYIKFEAVNDRCKIMDELRVGDEVQVHFNLRGRPFTDKAGKKTYFNSLGVWKIDVLKTVPSPTGYTAANLPDLDSHELPF